MHDRIVVAIKFGQRLGIILQLAFLPMMFDMRNTKEGPLNNEKSFSYFTRMM